MATTYQCEVLELDVIGDFEPTTIVRKSSNWMSRYEKARLVAVRARQIEDGEGKDPQVDITGCLDPKDIANLELEQRVIPLSIRRRFPDGSTEIWKPKDMNIPE